MDTHSKENIHNVLDELDRRVKQMEVTHKTARPENSRSVDEYVKTVQSTGILLWGPPGCGKSSIASELKTTFDPVYFINTDAIVDIVMQVWYKDIYNDIKAGLYSEGEKEESYWDARNTKFSDLRLPQKYVLNEILRRMDLPVKKFSDVEFNTFKRKSPVISVVTYAVVAFLIFLAKQRRHNFIKETNGNKFDHRVLDSVFWDVQSILQVVYVSSVSTLIKRVSARTDQLNTPSETIREIYHKSYFNSFQSAIKSDIFNEIIVTSNDITPNEMLVLNKRHARKGYALEVKPANTLNAEEYKFVCGILTSIGLSDTILHNNRSSSIPLHAFFCSKSFTWTPLDLEHISIAMS